MSTSTTTEPTGDETAEDPRIGRTRAAIIEAAAELMMADGPTEITHVNVAAAANVSRTTVYNHYPTRTDLLRATIEEAGKSVPDVTESTGDLRTDLGRFFADLIGDLLDEQRAPMIATMMERALHDSTFTAVRDELICDFEPAFRVVLDRGVEAGQLRPDLDPTLAMASIAGAFMFQRFMSPHGFDRDVAARIIDEFVRSNAPR